MFYTPNRQSNNNLKAHIQSLDNITLYSSSDPSVALIVSDAIIKNHTTTSIVHIHVHNKQVIKMLYHAVNVIFMEAKLFTIQCGIIQATNLWDIRKIIIITNSIHTTKKIFDYLSHSFQVYMASISKDLRKFFASNTNDTIKFWDCPSQCDWSLHKTIDSETKKFWPIPYLLCKFS